MNLCYAWIHYNVNHYFQPSGVVCFIRHPFPCGQSAWIHYNWCMSPIDTYRELFQKFIAEGMTYAERIDLERVII